MNERNAREVVLVRAIETADGAREIVSDADREWASRASAEIVGEHASDEAFLTRRAALLLERLRERYPRMRVLASPPTTRGILAVALAIGAFVIGALGVDVGPSKRINLLAPPLLGLLAWNLAVYVVLLVEALASRHRGDAFGPFRRAIVGGWREAMHPVRGSTPRPLAVALARFATDWSALALPIWTRRATRLLHVGAMMLAFGAIVGLYARGIAFEFRAGWQSTFLNAADVTRILDVVLAPGAWVTRLPLPDEAHVRAIGGAGAGENAASWIHLYAATIAIVVILPRLVLAAFAWIGERRLARRFPLLLEHAYYRRLVRRWREGSAQLEIFPYSFDVAPERREALARVMARVFDAGAALDWHPSTLYGDDAIPPASHASPGALVAIFNLAATPERENHAAFVEALRARAPHPPMIAVVDSTDFADRFKDAPQRIAEREEAWRRLFAAQRIEPLFVRLADPDLREAGDTLAMRLEEMPQ
ncbi:MAG TPA: DUF2868 domain-containing protein [Casimicrobiaceae bacterium]|nr:DUF2868 domain-containing protein [Casimicrobiaceae bacterium]